MQSKLSCAKPTVFKIKEWKHSEWKCGRVSNSLWYTEPRREGGQDGTPLYKLYRYVQLFLLKLQPPFRIREREVMGDLMWYCSCGLEDTIRYWDRLMSLFTKTHCRNMQRFRDFSNNEVTDCLLHRLTAIAGNYWNIQLVRKKNRQLIHHHVQRNRNHITARISSRFCKCLSGKEFEER